MPEINFDATSIEPQGDFTPLPVGEYTVIISSSEIKLTKTGSGQYLQFTYDVVDGEYKGRKIFDRLNIMNQNITAQEIAQRSLSAICRAVGVLTPKNSEELHNKPLIIKVAIRPASGEYGESNIVKGYSSCLERPIAPAQTATTTIRKSGKKPWE